MQREVPLPIAIVVIVVAVAVAGFFLWRSWTARRQLSEEAIRPPEEVTKEFQKRLKQQPGYIPPPSYGR